jgi:NAD(P)H dehydrogenase (quinone)
MILVTGATGHLGTAVIDTLLKHIPATQIAGLVRDPGKAAELAARGVDIRIGDYDDSAALDQAMDGVEKVLLISGTNQDNRVQQHRNVVAAATRAGVGEIAYTSRSLRDPQTLENALMKEHFQTEDDIKASGLTYTLFRNALYMDAIPLYVGGAHVFTVGIRLPAGDGRVAFTLRSEQGEAIANALLRTTGENRVEQLTGSESWSFDDVASALTELSGKPVAYTPMDATAFATSMRERGTPDLAIERIIGFMTDIKHGQEEDVTSTLGDLLGRKPASLKEGLKAVYAVSGSCISWQLHSTSSLRAR